ncbi:LAQU0S11e02916g1_1 [Lachancea quebecensis]|uniref:Protein transport protein SEC23 n=1 Tax=Lachancea quebecensis TaxID=1654605 RepID=A0A0P1KUG9_9SACH|nr:LAQU0S11e02916g1_1 [Lachancea quebecensis]
MITPSFSVIPTSRLEAELQLPYLLEPSHVDVLYESKFDGNETKTQYQICSSCGAAIIDKCVLFENQWVCGFCDKYNVLLEKPRSSSYISEVPESAEGLHAGENKAQVLLVDLNTDGPEELTALIQSVSSCLEGCPEAQFGLVTLYDGQVTVHTPTGSHTFSGDDSTTLSKAKNLDLEFFRVTIPGSSSLWLGQNQTLELIKLLSFKPTPVSNQRPKRATGLGLFLASLYRNVPDAPIVVSAFISGPCTSGPGKVVPKNKKHHIRQHYDLDSNRDKYFYPARSFYQSLVGALSVNCFIACLDQIGIVEMAPIIGSVSQFDTFDDESFRTLSRNCIRNVSTDHQITVFASKGLLVDGCFGPISKLNATQPVYSDTPCGVSGTNRWRYRTTGLSLSLAFSFQISTTATKEESHDKTQAHLAIQIHDSFQDKGKNYIKVDTIVLFTTNNSATSAPRSVAKSFNYTVALGCLMKQIAFDQFFKNHTDAFSLQQWRIKIDKLAARHSKVQSKHFSEFLEMLYRLKWTALLQKRNTSPDEAAIFQHTILLQDSFVCGLLCKPKVTVFTNEGQFEPSDLNLELLKVREAMCVNLGTSIMVRYLEEDPATAKAEEFAESLAQNNPLAPKIQKTGIRGSQDRYFISRLLPQDGLNTEDMSLEQYSANIKRMSQCI